MSSFADNVIQLFRKIHPLDRIPRSGFLLRGVTEPESVAAHSHFLALLVLLVTENSPGSYDGRKAVAMALVHDLAEAVTMDIPIPAGDKVFKDAKATAEQQIMHSLFEALDVRFAEYYRELNEAQTPEARLVKAMDRVQMMIKVLCYDREHRGNLAEFWEHKQNFDSYGIPEAEDLFREIKKAAART